MDELSRICAELQSLQRMRAGMIRQRIMQENGRRAFVANLLGYTPGQDEKARKAMFAEADAVIKAVIAGTQKHAAGAFIHAAEGGIASFLMAQRETEKEMLPLARKTPVHDWALAPEQRGFGVLSLATVIGETGDLRLYGNPPKVWKRLGCAPWSHAGKTQMGATWKSKGGLPAEQWSAFGYCSRRRSIAYVLGENLIKQNSVRVAGGGESVAVTEEPLASPGTTKASAGDSSAVTESARARAGRPKTLGRGDSSAVTESGNALPKRRKGTRGGEAAGVTESPHAITGAEGSGEGEKADDTDSSIARPGPYRARYDAAKRTIAEAHPDYSKLRCHRHGMLLATKLLLRNLWREWCPALHVGEWVAPELELAGA